MLSLYGFFPPPPPPLPLGSNGRLHRHVSFWTTPHCASLAPAEALFRSTLVCRTRRESVDQPIGKALEKKTPSLLYV